MPITFLRLVLIRHTDKNRLKETYRQTDTEAKTKRDRHKGTYAGSLQSPLGQNAPYKEGQIKGKKEIRKGKYGASMRQKRGK